MVLFTIGYNKYSSNSVINTLKSKSIDRVIDVRLWPNSVDQLKKHFKYVHMPELAPAREIITDYRDDDNWDRFERRFNDLMRNRDPLKGWEAADFNNAVLVCAEKSPRRCHRRLVAEMIHDKFGLEVVHL